MLGISLEAAHEIRRIVKIVTFKLFEVSASLRNCT
jgi:hypothetical protein